jgi:hypothetical protein
MAHGVLKARMPALQKYNSVTASMFQLEPPGFALQQEEWVAQPD